MKKALLALLLLVLGATPALAGKQDFVLVNASSSEICFVYVSPSNSDDWGDDILGRNECMPPDSSIEIVFDAGNQAMWDLRVEDNDGNYENYSGFNLMKISEITIKGGGQATYK